MFRLMDDIFNGIYFAPPDTGTGTVISPTPTKGVDLIDIDDIGFTKNEPEVIDLKKDDKSAKTDDDEADVDDSDKKSDEPDELDELLDETEEPSEEQLELATPSSRRAILKEYPELFKKFPSLEKSYYRDQKYTEAFPTPQEAIDAKGKVEVLDAFESDIMQGNTEAILKSVRDGDANAFYKVVDNFLPTLQKLDREAYLHVVGNNAKEIIHYMWTTGSNSSNEEEKTELQNAARAVNKFLFGSEKYAPPAKLSKDEPRGDNTKETELARKEKEFNDRQFKTAQNGLMDRINGSIRATINKNIDKSDSMPEYVKKNAIRDANETLDYQLKNDKRFQEVLSRLWEHAKSKDFSEDSLGKIKQAYTSKASSLLDAVIKKARREALTGIGKRVKDEEPDDSADDNKSPRREKPRTPNAGRDSNDDGNRGPKRGQTTAEWLAEK